ncbi:MAG: hypothetical protein ACREV1_18200 [Gammaproteobacteria bacterium]
MSKQRSSSPWHEQATKWADLEYVQILHLAATNLECEVESALTSLLEAGVVPEYEVVKARVAPADPRPARVHHTPRSHSLRRTP